MRAAKVAAIGGCVSSFERANPQAIKWAEKSSARLVKDVSAESRAAIRKVVARSIREGIPPRQAALLIKNSVGLTEGGANAVVNLHQKILTSPGRLVYAGKTPIRVPVGGMDPVKLDKVLQDYADRLLRQRAMNIARTETIAASNEGQMMLWQQAQARGELPKVIYHEWIAAASERTCPQCSALSGERVKVGESFSFGGANPPAHPSCRCTTGLVN